MKLVKMLLTVALFLVALVLGTQNQQVVEFNYLFAKTYVHVSTLLGCVFIFSFSIFGFIFSGIYLRKKLIIRHLRKQLAKYKVSSLNSTLKVPKS